jgi:hypothetical protein
MARRTTIRIGEHMEGKTEIRNAKITHTFLGREDHGIMTCFLHLDYGGAGQGFGGYNFNSKTFYGMHFIQEILNTLGVDTWEELPGTCLRVESDYGRIYRIGHLIEDKWFRPEDLYKKYSK